MFGKQQPQPKKTNPAQPAAAKPDTASASGGDPAGLAGLDRVQDRDGQQAKAAEQYTAKTKPAKNSSDINTF